MGYDNENGGGMPAGRGITGIEELLEKYFDGQTTLEEEKELKEFFASWKSVPEHLVYARALFGYFTEAAGETGTPAEHPGEKGALRSGRRGRRLVAVALSAAAAVALAVLFFNGPDRSGIDTGEEAVVYCYVDGVAVTNPDMAMLYYGKAFDRLAGTMGNPLRAGSTALDKLAKLETLSKLSIITDIMEIMETNE